jgi:hypothetical protein
MAVYGMTYSKNKRKSNPSLTLYTFLPKSVCVRFQWKLPKIIVLLYHLWRLRGTVRREKVRQLYYMFLEK